MNIMKAMRLAIILATSGICLSLAPSLPAQAKEKGAGGAADNTEILASDIAEQNWLSRAELRELLVPGMVWCMEPATNTCSFVSEITPGEATEVSYDVIGLWTRDIILRQPYDAWTEENGIICEHNVLNLKHLSFTDLSGNALDREALRPEFAELKRMYTDGRNPDRCYRYARLPGTQSPHYVQFDINDDGSLDNPIPFDVDMNADALDDYILRWDDFQGTN